MEKQVIYSQIDRRDFEIRRTLLDHVNISPYFFKGKPLPDKTSDNMAERAEIYALCEMLLSHFSSIVREVKQANGQPQEAWGPYEEQNRDLFASSVVLRDFFQKHSNRYHSALSAYLLR